MKVLFFGSESYPGPILKTLISKSKFQITGLVSSPNFSNDQNNIVNIAREFRIPVFLPKDVNNKADKILFTAKPDLILVCNYGQFLGKKILNYPKFKCLNVHFSLLPILRGACPVEMAILKGYKMSGVTIQIMELKMDSGDILFQQKVKLDRFETAKSLYEKLQKVTVKNIINVINAWIKGKIKPYAQNHTIATYCHKEDISSKKAKINWNKSAVYIERQIRAFNPKPVAWTALHNKRFKIFSSKIVKKMINLNPGETELCNDKLLVQTGDFPLQLLKVQLEGKKVMDASDFLRGYRGVVKFD